MRYSRAMIITRRDAPADAETISHQLMVRAGFIRQLSSGIYTYLTLCLRTLRKIEQIIRDEMNAAGAQELLMPIVQPASLWRETGRWGIYGKELLRLKDRKENDFCLGPTHEEVITDLVRNNIKSYRQLPVNLYQIQTKFRDEIRPRFGLMRGREFIMKDAYSFDVDEAAAHVTYQKMYEAYGKIFTRCGLTFKPVEAASGAIGGHLSHEFHVLADAGEDAIFSCPQCDYAVSAEKVTDAKQCPKCEVALESFRGIEVGHVFYLGDKYSKAMKATFLDDQGKEQYVVMGCYGIGVGRTAAAAIEQNNDDAGMIWPQAIAPYEVALLSLRIDDSEVARVSEQLYESLQAKGVEVIWDDRSESPGVKFNDADLIGFPFQIIVGARGLEKGEVELKNRHTSQKDFVPLDQIDTEIKRRLGHA